MLENNSEIVWTILENAVSVVVLILIFQTISGIRLGWKKWLGSATLVVLTTFIHEFLHLMVYFAFLFLIVRRYRPMESQIRRTFYSLAPYTVTFVFSMVTGIYFEQLLPSRLVEQYDSVLYIICRFMSLGLFYALLKIFSIDYESIRNFTYQKDLDSAFVPLNRAMKAYFGLVFSIPFLAGFLSGVQEGESDIAPPFDYEFINDQLSMLFFFIFLLSLVWLSYNIREQQEEEARLNKERQLLSLSEYSQHVEALYRELRSFRHDYTNILTSLREAIKAQDINQVATIYDAVLADTDRKFYEGKYDIAKLANITDDAIKSVLAGKLMAAQRQGVEVVLEVEQPIGAPDMELLDFITILSILVDNGIEAAREAATPLLAVAFFEDGGRTYLVVENSTQQAKVNITEIFEEGKSSKGQGRGIGLANVARLVDRNDNLSLQTRSRNYRFTQTLEIEQGR